jgi:DNA-binding XRE family transcriptional regulator
MSPLRAIRRSRGLTGVELAARAGVSLATVYSIERGRVTPQRATAYVLAATLGCRPEDIVPAALIDPQNELSPAGEPGSAKTSVGALGGEGVDVAHQGF